MRYWVTLTKTWCRQFALGVTFLANSALAGDLLPRPKQWVPVNDGVMGGLSRSHYREQAGYAGVFAGQVSLENNGGFASVRAPMSLAQADPDAQLRLRVVGDGKIYSLRLLTDRSFDGVAYTAPINTADGETTEHRFTASEFKPAWRGRAMLGAPPLRWQDVTQVGLMISSKQAGAFLLCLVSLDWMTEPE